MQTQPAPEVYFELQHIFTMMLACCCSDPLLFPLYIKALKRSQFKDNVQGHVQSVTGRWFTSYHRQKHFISVTTVWVCKYVNHSRLNFHPIIHKYHILSFKIRRRKDPCVKKRKRNCNSNFYSFHFFCLLFVFSRNYCLRVQIEI